MSDQTLGSIEAIASMDNWDTFNDFTREVIGLNVKEKGLAYNLKLASEELISNIIKAANDAQETKDHEVVLEISAKKHNESNRSWLIVRTKDNGCHFDPQFEQRLPIDTSQPVSERKIGGLGLFLIQQSVEKVSYKWEEGFNIYELWVGADIDENTNK